MKEKSKRAMYRVKGRMLSFDKLEKIRQTKSRCLHWKDKGSGMPKNLEKMLCHMSSVRKSVREPNQCMDWIRWYRDNVAPQCSDCSPMDLRNEESAKFDIRDATQQIRLQSCPCRTALMNAESLDKEDSSTRQHPQ